MTGSQMEDYIAFENNTVSTQSLPKIEKINFSTLSNKYRLANFCINILLALTMLGVALLVHYQQFFPIHPEVLKMAPVILLALAVIFLVQTVFQLFADKKKVYALRQQDLSYMSGLIFKQTVTQPILRIQHIELKRGPVDRKLGLARIQVFSAGGATHTFEIPGLPLDTAETIRQFILDHKNVSNHG